jgi:hypothetical protein
MTPKPISIPPFSLWNLASGETTQSLAILASPSMLLPCGLLAFSELKAMLAALAI